MANERLAANIGEEALADIDDLTRRILDTVNLTNVVTALTALNAAIAHLETHIPDWEHASGARVIRAARNVGRSFELTERSTKVLKMEHDG